jgi:hypothetical protein
MQSKEFITFLMVANVIAMYLVAEATRRRNGAARKRTFTMSYLQFIVAYLPIGFKVWFIGSSFLALGIIIFLLLSTGK